MAESSTGNVSAAQGLDGELDATGVTSLSLTTVMTVVGFACWWACLLVLLFSGTFAPLTESPMDGFLLRFTMLAGLAAPHVLAGGRCLAVFANPRLRGAVQVGTGVLLVLLTGMVVGPVAYLPLPLQLALWLLLGVALGLVLVMWGMVWSDIDAERADNAYCALAVGVSALLACLASCFMLFAPAAACAVSALALFALGSVLQALCLRVLPAEDVQVEREHMLKLTDRGMMVPLSLCVALGVVLGLNGVCKGVAVAFPLVLTGVALGACAQIAVTAARRRVLRPSTVGRFTVPLMGICLLVLPLALREGRGELVMVPALALATFFLVHHWDTLVLFAYRRHLPPAWHFGRGLIATVAGTALGWALVAVPLVAAGDACDGYTSLGWEAPGVPAFILGDGGVSVATVSCGIAVALLLVAPALSSYTTPGGVEELFIPAGEVSEGVDDVWAVVNRTVGERYGLTPREREVFAYLARGRNAEHIAEELVISLHTAKTHIARIYRKMGVNSLQQLIDVVEEELARAGYSA